MIAHKYKIWSWGGEREGGSEDCVKYDVGVTTVAKRNKYQPFEVFNELVCTELGRILGLPVPIGMVVEKGGHPFYCSGNVAPSNEFPPADLEHLATDKRHLFCGITVFDAWLLNNDRHGNNIFYDTSDGTVHIIDHGQALFATNGVANIRHNMDRIILRDEFAIELRYLNSFCFWYERIVRIPDSFIVRTMQEAAKVGVDVNDATEGARLLIKRRTDLPYLFRDHKKLFPKLIRQLFNPLACEDDPVDYCI